ncbi:MAG: polymer-forming cytoskeletal protein [Haloarculaceae archaeon]
MSTPVRRILPVLVIVIALAVVPATAGAQQVGGSVTIPPGTTQTGDISVVGGTVVVEGTLDGSLDGFAGSVLVTGTVTGDVEVATGSVTISGTVEGDVEAAAGAVTVTESGRVGGSLSAGAGDVSIDGTVAGDVAAGADRFSLGPTARVGGNVRYDAETVEIADGASVGGTTERVDGVDVAVDVPFAGNIDLGDSLVPAPVGFLAAFLANALLGAALLFGAPAFARRVTDTGTARPAASAGAGLATLVGVPVALVVVAITIVGIPLSFAGFLVYIPLLWVGFVYGALLTGTWVLGLAGYDSLWGGLAVGLALPALVSLVGVSWVVDLAYLLLGLGALALSALALRRGDRPLGGEGEHRDDEPAERPAGSDPA